MGPMKNLLKLKELKGLHANKYIYFQTSVYEYREFHRLGNDMPLLGSKEDFQTHDCDFPIHYPKRTVHMQDVAENLAFYVNVCCSVLDVDRLGKEDRRDVETNKTAGAVNLYMVKKQPKCVKQFDKIEEAGTAITYRCGL